ncbi:histidine kinase [Streptomyces sp. Je 1-4]|nr:MULTISPECIES: histidine kinase [unclassified Streptomyces]UYB43973.1 histidine kinase [Streptomyces sp. Je 1-4]UZQ40400.1 histidine kinase [Streptomyces sp. Je 1-4] [Streptomyces sp. Je 1-4 4N24]UZQ47817.1 histidine kinase [Streptomyces sp. Je 1-4] [Streptomyces sp. Je 1-4 4N24_ara]
MLFDIMVALGCAMAFVVLAQFPGGYPFGLPAPAFFALAVVAGLALIWRRRRPTLVCLGIIAATPFQVTLFALPISLYSLAKYGRSGRNLVILSAGAGLAAAVALLESGLASLLNRLPFMVLLVAGPVLLGMYAGARRMVVEGLREKAERLEREQRLLASQTRMEERTRIAREMHDVVAHRVSLMAIHAGTLEVDPANSEKTVQTAELIGGIGRQALEELRQVLGVLRTDDEGDESAPRAPQPTLDDVPLLVEQSRATGMRIELTQSGTVRPLDTSCERTAYRLVQEALTNVHKHTPGASTQVDLRYTPDALHVTVDNEAGLDTLPTGLPSGGHGLIGLRERVTVLGGTFEAGARSDGGFRVAAVLPTKPAATTRETAP